MNQLFSQFYHSLINKFAWEKDNFTSSGIRSSVKNRQKYFKICLKNIKYFLLEKHKIGKNVSSHELDNVNNINARAALRMSLSLEF